MIGVPDARWGERPKAFVIPREGKHADPDELMHHVKSRIARYKAPREIEIVSALPKTSTGKIQKFELRQKEWSGEEGRIRLAGAHCLELSAAELLAHVVGDHEPVDILDLETALDDLEHVVAADVVVAADRIFNGRIGDPLVLQLQNRLDRLPRDDDVAHLVAGRGEAHDRLVLRNVLVRADVVS